VANHVTVCLSLIKRSEIVRNCTEMAAILFIYILHVFVYFTSHINLS